MKIRHFHVLFLAMLGAFSPAYASQVEVLESLHSDLGTECSYSLGVVADGVVINFRTMYDVESYVRELDSPDGKVYYVSPSDEDSSRTVVIFCRDGVLNSVTFLGEKENKEHLYKLALLIEQ